MTNKHDDVFAAMSKVLVAWIGWIGGIELSRWVLFATLIYTVLQIVKAGRDLWKGK